LGSSFQPDFEGLDNLLCDLPILIEADNTLMDLPVNVPDLERAVEAASTGRSPRLNRL
jgi:hypothetical protein